MVPSHLVEVRAHGVEWRLLFLGRLRGQRQGKLDAQPADILKFQGYLCMERAKILVEGAGGRLDPQS